VPRPPVSPLGSAHLRPLNVGNLSITPISEGVRNIAFRRNLRKNKNKRYHALVACNAPLWRPSFDAKKLVATSRPSLVVRGKREHASLTRPVRALFLRFITHRFSNGQLKTPFVVDPRSEWERNAANQSAMTSGTKVRARCSTANAVSEIVVGQP